jgi:hypothetical protein
MRSTVRITSGNTRARSGAVYSMEGHGPLRLRNHRTSFVRRRTRVFLFGSPINPEFVFGLGADEIASLEIRG